MGIAIVLLVSVLAAISNSNYTSSTYHILHDLRPVHKIELEITTKEDSPFKKVIWDSSALSQFDAALARGQLIMPDAPTLHTVAINMAIYKDRKVNISVLKSVHSGWIVAAGDNWYRNDSLVHLLAPYLPSGANKTAGQTIATAEN
jgi:hypothetical protein